MGCDPDMEMIITCQSFISIHAPLTGCDAINSEAETILSDFNPRTPYGMRLLYTRDSFTFFVFQSTHPLRDATSYSFCQDLYFYYFNPRTPYGMRRRLEAYNDDVLIFQSTHPLRDATKLFFFLGYFSLFQSTHPLRDATIVCDVFL